MGFSVSATTVSLPVLFQMGKRKKKMFKVRVLLLIKMFDDVGGCLSLLNLVQINYLQNFDL